MGFYPDYKNVENAARNLPSGRMPLYEHIIAPSFMERVTGENLPACSKGITRTSCGFSSSTTPFGGTWATTPCPASVVSPPSYREAAPWAAM